MNERVVQIFRDTGALRSLSEIENDVMRAALRHCGGRMSRTARALGIGRSTAYRKLDRLQREMARIDAGRHHPMDDRIVGSR